MTNQPPTVIVPYHAPWQRANNALRRVLEDGGIAFLVIAGPLLAGFLLVGDFSAAAWRTLAVAVAVPTLTALVAFGRKLQRARAEDTSPPAGPVGERTPTHRSP